MNLLLLATVVLCFVGVITQKVVVNVQYGDDKEQVLDMIVPPGNNMSKAILLIHGGAWVSGKRQDMNDIAWFLYQHYPQYLIATMDYRLGSATDPGFPKQLIDIDTALKFLISKAGGNLSFALVGGSAGAHLAMLYSYAYDYSHVVKAIVNVVGPADFSAWNYASNPIYNQLFMGFTGPYYYWQNPGLYYNTSPRSWVNATSAKTISFYGENDPLVPADQGPLLAERLNQAGVTNELYLYPGGHGDLEPQYQNDLANRSITFLNKYF